MGKKAANNDKLCKQICRSASLIKRLVENLNACRVVFLEVVYGNSKAATLLGFV